jgi:hypothetical protein
MLIAAIIVITAASISICRRAGYSGWWGLLMLVPIVDVIFFLIFAWRTWPIERELAALRLGIKNPQNHIPGFPVLDVAGGNHAAFEAAATIAPAPSSADVATIFTEAAKLERIGEWEAAISLYDQLATQLAGSQDSHYAQNCATRLRNRLTQRPQP